MYDAVEPSERRTTQRRGARVVVRCEGRVLLLHDRDPGVPGSGWWVLPGGGIDPDESPREAAVRELFEETGHRTRAELLQGPVVHRVVTHGYSDRILVQEEDFFLLDVPEVFKLAPAALTEGEKVRLDEWGWFARDELAAMTIWPSAVTDLLDWDGEPCLEMGQVDESTVPVAG